MCFKHNCPIYCNEFLSDKGQQCELSVPLASRRENRMEVVSRGVTVKGTTLKAGSFGSSTTRLVTAYHSHMNFAVYHIRNNIDADVCIRIESFRCVLQLYTTTLIGFLVSRSRVRDSKMACRRHGVSYPRIRRVIAICAPNLDNV